MKTLFFACIMLFSTTLSFSQIELELWKGEGLLIPDGADIELDTSSGTSNFIYYYQPGLEISITPDKQTWGGEREPLPGPYMEQAVSRFISEKGIQDSETHKLEEKNLLKIFAIYPNSKHTNSLYGFVYNGEKHTSYLITGKCENCIDVNLKKYMKSINLPSNHVYWGEKAWYSISDINQDRKVVLALDSLVRDSDGIPLVWDFYVKHISNDYHIIRAHELEDAMINIAGLPLGRNLEVYFLNAEMGFLYGYLTGYGFYSFMYKTLDGGKSWRKIPKSMQFGPIDEDGLFMFDEQRGILIPRWRELSILRYYLTEDGGESWVKKEVKILSKKKAYDSRGEKVMMHFNKKGEINISFLRDSDKDHEDYHLVVYSSNFGKKFKVIKGWKKLDDDY